ncbi:hypothetical protein ACLESD_10140 [Pyxidicoccus sp. 3LFB2]
MTKVVRCTPAQAAKTYEYLSQFVRFEAEPKLTVAAVFARCCLATHPAFELDAARAAEEAATLARAALDHPDRARLDLDPLLLVSCHAVLADKGIKVAPLTELLAEVARAFVALPPDLRKMGRVRHVASLLADCGFAVKADPPGKEVLELTKTPSKMLNASVQTLTELVDHLSVDKTELSTDLTVMLALTALGELRNYRVDLGAKLLRLVVARGQHCEELEEGMNFIALQRRRNGAYGFYNPFQGEESAEKMEKAFFLPMTLNAAWLFRTEAANLARWRRSAQGGVP